ncbi:MAG: FG-GAP repeat protein [Chitinophagaceae bacterium]|nr:FG-GAP repeat protein [Chitinophagaceae bacterium]
MYKIFTLAVAVSVLPISKQYYPSVIDADDAREKKASIFPYKNSTTNFFDPEKKVSEPWSQNWMASAQENIRKSEYNFVWEEKLKAYCTPNRKNNLRFFYDDNGFVVEPRLTKMPVDKVDKLTRQEDIKYRIIPNWKVKFNLDKNQVGNGKWQIVNNKAEYITDNITVQYINNDEGMRQNFIVQSPLSNNDELKINFSIKTKLKTYLHGNQLQFFHKKTNVLNYDQLKVWDANGKSLIASILLRQDYGGRAKRNKFYIQVDTKGAAYPITIDPLSNTPNSTLDDANQAGCAFGYSVASAGDVNGDGYSDVIVGAPYYDEGAIVSEGRAFVYYGSASGLLATPSSTPDDANQASAFFGWSVASAGDVNGDGFSDIIVGAYGYQDGANTFEGRAFVYHGSAAGLSASPNSTPDDGNAVNATLGYSVACAGDVNGDGYSDVIIGGRYYNSDEGRAWVYHGSGSGLLATPSSIADVNVAGAFFGNSVASAGDINGDGYSDVIIGSTDNNGGAYIYNGSGTGISASPTRIIHDGASGDYVGPIVTSAGDINGDGYSDVALGGGINRVVIYHGSGTGLSASANSTLTYSGQTLTFFGIFIACAGDVNGDGYSDLIVGAPRYDDGANVDEGAAFIYHGSSTGVSASPNSMPDDGNQAGALFGQCVAAAGDVNGDGYSDVIIGAFLFDDGANAGEGRAFAYHGSAAGLSASPTSTPDDANQAGAALGISVASAGDINADGYSDVIIGANAYDDGANANEGRAFIYHGSATGLSASPNATPDDANQAGAQFGQSVNTAGDVNGDGYSDVIIGAPNYTDGANTFEGRAYVYQGSAAGLSASPNSTLDDINQATANFGISVAGAGDINGDGYSDVIVGCHNYNDGANGAEGRAFVYHGSATGLSATPNNMPDDANQAGANFGYSVASAGDVNGDGYCDVIIGAIGYDDGANTAEGRAYVYHGSATGLSASPNSTPDDANQAIAQFGFSVASAGDVNGDGYSDIIIGAIGYDDGANINEGRAFVYYGSAAGLSASPNSTLDDANQGDSWFGISVDCAGDVNGDGYNDVIVGAYEYDDGANADEGRAYIYHGSPSGLSTSPNNTLDDANQAGAVFGTSVACAGDVNGDGYSDVIIGARLYDDGANTTEGRAFLYNGNEFTSNERNNLRLYNTNLTTTINSSNFILGNFGIGLFAKSFLGRNRGKLVWETRLSQNAYSGNPITNSVLFTGQEAAYSNLGTAGIELKEVISKLLGAGKYTKVRARVKYNPALAITGQVYGPWRYVSAVIDGNSLGALPLELISFKAAWLQKGKSAKINFTTDKESGICCFDIEKSTDGISYTTIGSIPAKNTAAIQDYSFVDENAINKNQFYRLKIKGIDAKVEYSNIQQLQYSGATDILVFPNPTTDFLQLQLNGSFQKMSMQIVNSSGQVVKQLTVSASNQTITIPVQNLAAGQYWLKLQSGEEKQVLQFIKQ